MLPGSLIQSLFDEWSKIKYPFRERIVIPPGDYKVSQTLVLRQYPVTVTDGSMRGSRGVGPVVETRGVRLFAVANMESSPLDPTHSRACMTIIGVRPVFPDPLAIRDLPEAGMMPGHALLLDAYMAGANVQMSGRRGGFEHLTIEGSFSGAAVHSRNHEEMTFGTANIKNHHGPCLTLENRSHSCKCVNFSGFSLEASNDFVVRLLGDINRCSWRDGYMSSPYGAFDARYASGSGNRVDCVDLETSSSGVMISGNQGMFSKTAFTKSINPAV